LFFLRFPLYFYQLSPQLRILLLRYFKHSSEGFQEGGFLSLRHYNLHKDGGCRDRKCPLYTRWSWLLQVLKLLNQLHHHILEAQSPPKLRTVQTTTAPSRSKLSLNTRGFDVWEIAEQY